MKFLSATYRCFIIAVFLLLVAISSYAQTTNKEKVESMRIAFITNRLDLTPDESRQFWPVYNSYRHDLGQLRRSFFPKDDGSDPHLDADRQLDFEQRKVDLRRHYKSEFEQVIGKAKVNKLVGAEEDFKRLLIQTMRNRRQQRPGRW
jgi:hypothetical protein